MRNKNKWRNLCHYKESVNCLAEYYPRFYTLVAESPWIFLDKSGRIQGDSASPGKKERVIDAEKKLYIEVLYIEEKPRYGEAITTVKVSNLIRGKAESHIKGTTEFQANRGECLNLCNFPH